MKNETRSITAANDNVLCDLIARAAERLIVLAPAVSVVVASTISSKWKQLGGDRVNVILDLDPEVFRLGYGEFDGMKLLESTAADLGTMIQRQPGIRIGLLVSDTTMRQPQRSSKPAPLTPSGSCASARRNGPGRSSWKTTT